MKMFIDTPKIYLHKQPVDFRKSINGLSLLVEQDMQQSAAYPLKSVVLGPDRLLSVVQTAGKRQIPLAAADVGQSIIYQRTAVALAVTRH